MPYFERKPFVSALRTATKAVPEQDTLPISQIARGILNAENSTTQQLDGPFHCRKPCRPGETGTILLSFAAPAGADVVDLQFEPGDMISRDGNVLPTDKMSIQPSAVRIPPGQAVDVAVSLTIHDLAEPGQYQGRVYTKGSENTAIVVTFEVVAD
ncbi:hypothetical protein [Ruegeria faecimaris]|uniref:Uncharacterized protein n=1 Tax=Ruegeria faecimaris TaxID=686389 RepID=A0A521E8U5_9RHOB|nr:hypothetical protein [Ruegeria faecimaris]SMO80365.1 hypothetical protein SAMN06265380_11021 [Ruegeria faecimaris]